MFTAEPEYIDGTFSEFSDAAKHFIGFSDKGKIKICSCEIAVHHDAISPNSEFKIIIVLIYFFVNTRFRKERHFFTIRAEADIINPGKPYERRIE